MNDTVRIDELRRRVQADPASITFAALAEEYRRIGKFNDAIETCLGGLKRHPSYLSARVTLGRALIEVGRFDEAEQELQFVLKSAPENLAAIRGLADIHHRRRDHGYDEAQALATLQQHVDEAVAAEVAAPIQPADASPAAAEAVPVPEPAAQPSPYEPAAYVAAAWETAAHETASFTPAPDVPAVVEPEAGAYKPFAHEPPAFVAPSFQAPLSSEPLASEESLPSYAAMAAYAAPAAYEPAAVAHAGPVYDTPKYDPPGTFEFPELSLGASDSGAYELPAFDLKFLAASGYELPSPATPSVVEEQHHPQLAGLERFLEAIVASRRAIPAH